MNSFISWVGGKMSLRDEIIARFPLKYDRYVEVFGGAGWVLFHKAPDKSEVFNDFNTNLVNLYRVVKRDPEALIRELDWTLNSRDDFERIKSLFKDDAPMDEVERAANFFRLIRLSYGSKCVSFGCQPSNLERKYPAIRGAHRRLQDVVIENQDFEVLLRHYSKPEVFCYLDPPYFGTEDYYLDVDFTRADHIRLRDTLLGTPDVPGIKGYWLLSYNDCPEIRALYHGCYIESTSRPSNLALDSDVVYPEIYISNYDTSQRARQNEQLSIII